MSFGKSIHIAQVEHPGVRTRQRHNLSRRALARRWHRTEHDGAFAIDALHLGEILWWFWLTIEHAAHERCFVRLSDAPIGQLLVANRA